MATMLFHKDVFIPDVAKQPICAGALSYSTHARNVTAPGAYEEIVLPRTFNADASTLIEAEVDDSGQVVKQVWRTPLNDKSDLCMAVLPGGFVKTVWLNDRIDTHSTLNKARYVTSYNWRCRKKPAKTVA